jgi:hypothetical protein
MATTLHLTAILKEFNAITGHVSSLQSASDVQRLEAKNQLEKIGDQLRELQQLQSAERRRGTPSTLPLPEKARTG